MILNYIIKFYPKSSTTDGVWSSTPSLITDAYDVNVSMAMG